MKCTINKDTIVQDDDSTKNEELKKTKNKMTLYSKKQRERIFIILMLAIPLLQHWIFFVYPNLDSFFLAFKGRKYLNSPEYWTLDNFKIIFKMLSENGGNSELLISLRNSVIFWLFQSVFMFSLSYIWTYFFYKKIRGVYFFRVIFYVTSIVGVSATCAILKFTLNSNGLLGSLYKKINNETIPTVLILPEYTMKILLGFVFWCGFGGSYILFGGAFSKIPKEVLEAGLIDGVDNMWKEIHYLIFPLTWPTFSTLFLINLSQILISSGPILLLTENQPETYTLSYWIFKRVAFSQSYYVPSALGLLMTVVTLPIFFISRKLTKLKEGVEY